MASDFERFQREQEAARRAQSDANDDDIRRDEAYERQHSRKRRGTDGVKRRHTPLWRMTAGSWAQVLISGAWWGLFGLLVFSTTTAGKDQALQTWLWLGSLLPAIVLGAITWSLLGPAWRDRARILVRAAPFVIIGGLAVAGRWWGTAEPRRDASPATAPAAAAPAPPPPPVASPPAARSLADADLAVGAALVGQWGTELARCVDETASARRVPTSGGRSLAERLACVRTHERERADVERFAGRHAHALVDAARDPGASAGLLLAAGHVPDPAVAAALVAAADRAAPQDTVLLVEALTAAALRHPEAMAAALATAMTPEAATSRAPTTTLTLAIVQARTARDPRTACATVAAFALDVEMDRSDPARDERAAFMRRSRAERALDALTPRCDSVVDEALVALDTAARTPATRTNDQLWALNARAGLVRFGSLHHFARSRAVLAAMNAEPGLTLAAQTLASSTEALAERAFERAVGLSSMVFQHDATRSFIDRDDVIVAPCDDAALGVVKRPKKGMLPAPRPSWRPDCVVTHRAPDWLRGPLTAWQAALEGWSTDAHRGLTVPIALTTRPR